jgi:hypothetical protein
MVGCTRATVQHLGGYLALVPNALGNGTPSPSLSRLGTKRSMDVGNGTPSPSLSRGFLFIFNPF